MDGMFPSNQSLKADDFAGSHVENRLKAQIEAIGFNRFIEFGPST